MGELRPSQRTIIGAYGPRPLLKDRQNPAQNSISDEYEQAPLANRKEDSQTYGNTRAHRKLIRDASGTRQILKKANQSNPAMGANGEWVPPKQNPKLESNACHLSPPTHRFAG